MTGGGGHAGRRHGLAIGQQLWAECGHGCIEFHDQQHDRQHRQHGDEHVGESEQLGAEPVLVVRVEVVSA